MFKLNTRRGNLKTIKIRVVFLMTIIKALDNFMLGLNPAPGNNLAIQVTKKNKDFEKI